MNTDQFPLLANSPTDPPDDAAAPEEKTPSSAADQCSNKATPTTRRGLPMRRSAQKVAKRVAEITAWESASESSAAFQQAASAIEKEFVQEKRRKLSRVKQQAVHDSEAESDVDEDELVDSDADESELMNSEPDDASDSDADFQPTQQNEPCTQSQSSSAGSSEASALDDDDVDELSNSASQCDDNLLDEDLCDEEPCDKDPCDKNSWRIVSASSQQAEL
jgi:hypothetical protein